MLSNLVSFIKSREFILLLLLFFAAFLFRFFLLPEKLFFGPEQGRDFLVIKDIAIDHHPTLIGSKTDIGGVFHGPIFYYLAVIPFIFSKGDPVVASAFFVLINSFTVFSIYLLGKKLLNERVGFLAAMIFTVSYAAIVYARWLSNPPLSILFSTLFFLAFFSYLKSKDVYLVLVAFLFGLLVQIQFLNLVFFSGILFVLLILHFNRLRNTSIVVITFSILTLIGFSLGNFVLFDLRHDFLITNSLGALLSGESGYYVSYFQVLVSVVKTGSIFFGQTAFPLIKELWVVVGLTVSLVIFFAIYLRDNNLRAFHVSILVWIFAPVTILILLRHEILFHFFIPLLVPAVILVSFLIDRTMANKYIAGSVLLLLVIIGNLYAFMVNIPQNRSIFFQENQPELTIADQKKVIDAIYKDAEGQPFSFQSYTIPYWSQQAWEYLFWQHGQQQYGYYPVPEKAERLYVIIQADPSSKKFQDDWLKNTVSKWGSEVKEFKYGILTVKRLRVEY